MPSHCNIVLNLTLLIHPAEYQSVTALDSLFGGSQTKFSKFTILFEVLKILNAVENAEMNPQCTCIQTGLAFGW